MKLPAVRGIWSWKSSTVKLPREVSNVAVGLGMGRNVRSPGRSDAEFSLSVWPGGSSDFIGAERWADERERRAALRAHPHNRDAGGRGQLELRERGLRQQ